MDVFRGFSVYDFFNYTCPRDRIKFILQFGILAPSTHNSQPWKFRINENVLEVYVDKSVNITEADPTERDLYISIGCLLENIIIASYAYDFFEKINYGDSLKGPIARVFFSEDYVPKSQDRLLDTKWLQLIMKRRNVRGAFLKRKIPNDILYNLTKKNEFEEIDVSFFDNPKHIEYLANLTKRGLQIAYTNQSFRKEMSKWFRNNFSTKRDGLPGYSLGMPDWLSIVFPYLVRYLNIGEHISKLNYNSFVSSPAVFVVSSRGDNVKSWINVGRLAQRMMLSLNSYGISTSIYVAAIEMGDLRREVFRFANSKLFPQFLFCAGYSDVSAKYTPRLSVEEQMLDETYE